MKMGILKRIIFTFYLLIVIAFSAFVLSIGIGIISMNTFLEYMHQANSDILFKIISIIVSLLLILFSLILLIPKKDTNRLPGALIRNTEMGSIQVSLATLNLLAQKAVRNFDEIKDVKSNIISEMDGIRVYLKIMVMPDVKIPEITQSVQREVKDYLQSLSGILVKEIQIFVDNFTTPQKQRVE